MVPIGDKEVLAAGADAPKPVAGYGQRDDLHWGSFQGDNLNARGFSDDKERSGHTFAVLGRCHRQGVVRGAGTG